MTTGKATHETYDATAGIRQDLVDLPDDEARGAFCVAAVDHANRQLETLEKQLEAVTEKAAEVTRMWDEKVAEAKAIRDRAEDTLNMWQSELDERAGF